MILFMNDWRTDINPRITESFKAYLRWARNNSFRYLISWTAYERKIIGEPEL